MDQEFQENQGENIISQEVEAESQNSSKVKPENDNSNPIENDPNSLKMSEEQQKRHRRKKDSEDERNFKCPECDKCYFSASSMMTHRKLKHGYALNGMIKSRGRPRKDASNNMNMNNPQNKDNNSGIEKLKRNFDNFFLSQLRCPASPDPEHESDNNNNELNKEVVKNNFSLMFKQMKKLENTVFKEDLAAIEDYKFYKFVLENWDNNEEEQELIKKFSNCLDGQFFLYLKIFSKKTNKDYFWFMLKFIVLFREFINQKFANAETKEEHTETHGAEDVPDMCNDFYIDFMEPNKFFGLNNNELIEIIQHYCFWIYSNSFTDRMLTLL